MCVLTVVARQQSHLPVRLYTMTKMMMVVGGGGVAEEWISYRLDGGCEDRELDAFVSNIIPY